MDFSRRNVPSEWLKIVMIPKTNHFIPWTDYEQVRAELLELL